MENRAELNSLKDDLMRFKAYSLRALTEAGEQEKGDRAAGDSCRLNSGQVLAYHDIYRRLVGIIPDLVTETK